ncbi:hypothetical protein RHMOL_Rhmol11G0134200 [Rhododendron molle]|uniref:Uncharacterized protein n=1 Tax=Rhododendron molle TaxID=49168 RepID=A0ACC0LRN3_RHOML|nr:hypothetical protein RHMOL_Rhmol11G0134200 [Rhododendron molle]
MAENILKSENPRNVMGLKPRVKAVGAEGRGGGTEAKAANPIARGARTKSTFVSLIPSKRKLVKKMMWDSMVQAIVSCFCSINKKKKKKKDNNKNKTFPA